MSKRALENVDSNQVYKKIKYCDSKTSSIAINYDDTCLKLQLLEKQYTNACVILESQQHKIVKLESQIEYITGCLNRVIGFFLRTNCGDVAEFIRGMSVQCVA